MIRAIRPKMDRQPAPGAVVVARVDRVLMAGHRWRRWIVESFPALREHRHLVNLRALDNGQRATVSGFYCEEVPS